jgi:hypothetical protein
MDPWKELAALEDCRDAVRTVSKLGGRRPLTDDVCRRRNIDRKTPGDALGVLGLAAKLITFAVEVWRVFGRR